MDNILNIEELKKSNNSVKIGELSQNVIDILGLDSNPRNIYMWPDRLNHCEKHKNDFETEDDYVKSLENIPLIIEKPDFVGIHSNNKGIYYIKKLKNNCLVGVTMDSMLFRSMYPIKESKLKNYIKLGKIFPIN